MPSSNTKKEPPSIFVRNIESNKRLTATVGARGELFESCEYPFARTLADRIQKAEAEPFPPFDPYVLEGINRRPGQPATTVKGEPGEYLYGHSFAVKELAGPDSFPTPFDYEFVYNDVDIEFKPTYESHIAPKAPPARLSKSLPSSPNVHPSKFESFPPFEESSKPRSDPEIDTSSEIITQQSPLSGKAKSGTMSKHQQGIVTQLKIEKLQNSGAPHAASRGQEKTYRAYVNGKEVTGANEKDSNPHPKMKEDQPKDSSEKIPIRRSKSMKQQTKSPSEDKPTQNKDQNENKLVKYASAWVRKHAPEEGNPVFVSGGASGPHLGLGFKDAAPKVTIKTNVNTKEGVLEPKQNKLDTPNANGNLAQTCPQGEINNSGLRVPRKHSHQSAVGSSPKPDPTFVCGEAVGPHLGFAFKDAAPIPTPKKKPKIRTAKGTLPQALSHGDLSKASKLSPSLASIRAFSLKDFKRNMSARILRIKKAEPSPAAYRVKMIGLPDQEIPVPDLAAQLMQDRVNSISHWVNMIPTDEKRFSGNFTALTTSELLHIGGANLDQVERVKKYHCPTNTPDNEGIYPDEYDDILIELDTQLRHKDLIKYLGTRNSGFHLFSNFSIENTYEDPINLSDYYGLPLIEPDKCLRVAETLDLPCDDDTSSIYSFYETSKPSFHPPRRHLPPAQSLILFLHGKGLSVHIIVAILSDLIQEWVIEYEAPDTPDRTFKGLFVPELPDFSDELVNRIMKGYRRDLAAWEIEGATDEWGLAYGEDWIYTMYRAKESELKTLVRKVVENHIWWRLRGKLIMNEDLAGWRI